MNYKAEIAHRVSQELRRRITEIEGDVFTYDHFAKHHHMERRDDQSFVIRWRERPLMEITLTQPLSNPLCDIAEIKFLP